MYRLFDDDPTGIETTRSLPWCCTRVHTKIVHLLLNYSKLAIINAQNENRKMVWYMIQYYNIYIYIYNSRQVKVIYMLHQQLVGLLQE